MPRYIAIQSRDTGAASSTRSPGLTRDCNQPVHRAAIASSPPCVTHSLPILTAGRSADVSADVGAYSQARAVEDATAVLDAAGVEAAHVVGLSMGGFATLHLVLSHPQRVHSAVVAGVGYGAQPERQEQFRRESNAIADAFERDGSARVAEGYAVGPARVQLQNKNPEA